MDIRFKHSRRSREQDVDFSLDQSNEARAKRLEEGRCPCHDKPLLQSDVWYRPRNGQRYTFVSCMHHSCRVEAICNSTYDNFTLVAGYQYLLEQDNGTAKILNLDNKRTDSE